jgi:hypothetical protein
MSLTSGGTLILGSGANETEINCGALDINASGALTIDPLTFTMNSTALTGTAMTWQSNTTGSDLILSNPTAGAFSIESGAGQNLQFKTTSAGDLDFLSDGDMFFNAVSTFGMDGTSVGITATTNDVNITATLGGVVFTSKTDTDITSSNGGVNITATTGDVELTGTDVTITSTGTGAGEFVVRANTNVDIKTTTGNIEIWATTTMLNKSGGTNTLEVDGSNKMVTTNTTTTFTNTTVAINGNTTVNPDNTFNMMPTATIIQNVSATVPSGFLYCNGQAVSRTVTYNRLFAAIGTTFGVGNGSTTFNVPNFQGAFLRGAGNQTVSGTVHTAAALGTAQADDVLEHLHTYSDLYWWDDNTAPAGSTRTLTGADYQNPGGDNNGMNADGGQTKVMTSSAVYAAGATQANAATTPSPAIGAETRPMNYAVYYYIRY